MHRLSDNYYYRKSYLKKREVPTQTVMKNEMGNKLALICFKSLSPEEKVEAGLEPPLKGGGSVWYMPPEKILRNRHVLKPVETKHLKKLNLHGIMLLGKQLQLRNFGQMHAEEQQAVLDQNNAWKKSIGESNQNHQDQCSIIEANKNTDKLRVALHTFEHMYRKSVVRIEEMALDAATEEIKSVRAKAFLHMKNRYAELLDCQARRLYDHYEGMLARKKEEIKSNFISDVETVRYKMGHQIRDIIYEKHLAIEKFRHIFMCRNLACQVYVALREKEECNETLETTLKAHKKETERLNQELHMKAHEKEIERLNQELHMKDFEINLATAQKQKRQEFNQIWKKKVCHIVQKFQMFVQYCLVQLPQHAEFFLDMEKLMLLQISKALENPTCPSIIQSESECASPIPRPHPFYLFCDKGNEREVDHRLCPAHCTSSASDVPVIVINKRCVYSACDTFPKLSKKVTDSIFDDGDIYDNYNYEKDVPVKISNSQQLLQLNLESSIMQILQTELPNVREMPVECRNCELPFCFCTHKLLLPSPSDETFIDIVNSSTPGNEPRTKWQCKAKRRISIKIETRKCPFTKRNNHEGHLPLYMQQMLPYEPEMPYYEKCNTRTLKQIVKESRGLLTPPQLPPKLPKSETGVQCSDPSFVDLCACFSDDELLKVYKKLKGIRSFDPDAVKTKCSVVGISITASDLAKSASSFATDRAFSLRKFLDDKPSLRDIFQKTDCRDFD